jgi:hypothetical protein
MLTVTQQAAARLQEVLMAQYLPPGYGVKVVPDEAGEPRLTVGRPRAGFTLRLRPQARPDGQSGRPG